MKKIIVLSYCFVIAIGSFAQNTFPENGKVGIGTTTPAQELDVHDPESTGEIMVSAAKHDAMLKIFTNRPRVDQSLRKAVPENEGWAIIGRHLNRSNQGLAGDLHIVYKNKDGWMPSSLVIDQVSGGVGILTDVVPKGYVFAVDGKMICEELKVQLEGDWPDYVFASDYQLPSLDEVERSIQIHGHLPGIPSAATIEEAGGVEVGEMQRLMMEKIEELTLYMIDLKKENEALKARVEHLEAQK